MKSILALAVVGLLLFGVSAGISWMIVAETEVIPEEVAEGDMVDGAEAFPPIIDLPGNVEGMPVDHLSGPPLTVDMVIELTEALMQKESKLVAAEKRLVKEEKRIRILFGDLTREREELTAFAESVDAKVKAAREAVELLKIVAKGIADDKKTIASMIEGPDESVETAKSTRLDEQVASIENIVAKLPPDSAATVIRNYANQGEMELVARLLKSMGNRDSVKILGALNDKVLVAEIIDEMMGGNSRSSGGSDTILR